MAIIDIEKQSDILAVCCRHHPYKFGANRALCHSTLFQWIVTQFGPVFSFCFKKPALEKILIFVKRPSGVQYGIIKQVIF